MEIKILVATHKDYWMPRDKMYLPVRCGVCRLPDTVTHGFQRDDIGDNISDRNSSFCELTALYWAWKNLDAEYLGLVHYRRYFAQRLTGEKRSRIADDESVMRMLKRAPVILPCKRHYWIDTNYGQYVHAHHAEDLAQTRVILSMKCPEYMLSYDASMKRTSGHRFNMFVMRHDLLDAYCTWLFEILFELEKSLDISHYSTNDRRVFGFVAERLLDCWIETNHITYTEMPVVNLENQHWLKKGAAFLMRRFRGKITSL
ncbi:DUF4422 domain-containing protein [Caproiciproducens sp. R1]|uniref:DUF4422 domain-containing protein n=1 Tax=Caproiciproducens sp. R1 TaxID=3435000 RepID=UPI0040339216